MDPIAHTLVGVTLGNAGLRRMTPYGAAALVIGANLPDIDALARFWGGDTALCVRRGWTHGVLAMALLPFLLAGFLYLLGRLRGPGRPPPAFPILLGLSVLSVLTHPALDWLNNYGVRLLMPLDGRWFYGDTLFIVDPWIWLVLGGTAFLVGARTGWSVAVWMAGLAGAAALMLGAVGGLWLAKLLWLAGAAIFIVLKIRQIVAHDEQRRRLAKVALAVVALYIGVMYAASRWARSIALAELEARGIRVEKLMVGPEAVTPFEKDVVAATPEGYRYGTLYLLRRPRLKLENRILPKLDNSPVIQEALRSPEIRGFVNWARFPYAEVEKTGNGHEVYVMDARFGRRRARGFGAVKVVVNGR
jgi:inner membrane protein